MTPRTGSQGLSRDLWALCQAACYEVPGSDESNVHQGHRIVPASSVEARFACIDVPWDGPGSTVPFSPHCKKCRQVGKRVMERRGLTREQIKNCFDALGAKWEWTSRETDEKRKNSESGGQVVIGSGGTIRTEQAEKALQRGKARREAQWIERQDRKARRLATN